MAEERVPLPNFAKKMEYTYEGANNRYKCFDVLGWFHSIFNIITYCIY